MTGDIKKLKSLLFNSTSLVRKLNNNNTGIIIQIGRGSMTVLKFLDISEMFLEIKIAHIGIMKIKSRIILLLSPPKFTKKCKMGSIKMQANIFKNVFVMSTRDGSNMMVTFGDIMSKYKEGMKNKI
jgi:hypothetical protein